MRAADQVRGPLREGAARAAQGARRVDAVLIAVAITSILASFRTWFPSPAYLPLIAMPCLGPTCGGA